MYIRTPRVYVRPSTPFLTISIVDKKPSMIPVWIGVIGHNTIPKVVFL
ncbi:TPA: hypothetical protein HA338_10690 [Methanosarcina acetivorans]|uniref:Uncharacterized protein n=1 Tax=Methanosarcina acetivorans TaxID=2214 RepID=A0A832SHK2_9EURY|nr:hypothetical protein [Methanosarcina acetivorans]HIH94464.1 hypothetical protein [Methanosarcina acetivorans]